MACARICAWFALARATGTSTFIALCAATRPATTSFCTRAGNTRTRSRRRATQLRSRTSRRAISSTSSPWPSTSSASKRPSSRAVAGARAAARRTHRSASPGDRSRTTARTRSRQSFRSAATRRCPSITMNRSAPTSGTTVIGNCWPCSSRETMRSRSSFASRTRTPRKGSPSARSSMSMGACAPVTAGHPGHGSSRRQPLPPHSAAARGHSRCA